MLRIGSRRMTAAIESVAAMNPIHHLNVRVAWHDNRWNGAVCLNPSANSFCVDLDRIRAERDDAKLDRHAGKWFSSPHDPSEPDANSIRPRQSI